MRPPLLASLLFAGLAPLAAAPTSQEQANYDAACQAIVDAVNAYRAGSGKAPLTPLVELCQAAREDAEYVRLGVGTNLAFYDRASAAGYTGTYLSGSTAFYLRGKVAPSAMFQRFVPSTQAIFLSDTAESIGVGFAFRAQGNASEYQMRIILGRPSGMTLGGTSGFETGTGRGLLAHSLFREVQAGAWTGNSIAGYVRDPDMIVLTEAQEKAFASTLAAFLRRESVQRLRRGRAVVVKLPAPLLRMVEKFVLRGRLPAGIRFDRRKGTFRGRANAAGNFTVTLSGNLRGPVNGSEKLKPLRIRFRISP